MALITGPELALKVSLCGHSSVLDYLGLSSSTSAQVGSNAAKL